MYNGLIKTTGTLQTIRVAVSVIAVTSMRLERLLKFRSVNYRYGTFRVRQPARDGREQKSSRNSRPFSNRDGTFLGTETLSDISPNSEVGAQASDF